MSKSAIKRMFFDRQAVIDAVGAAEAKVFAKGGAFVRRRARSSLRRSSRTSRPGEPPKGKTGKLRDYVFFSFDPARRTVLVGPARIVTRNNGRDGRPVAGTEPEVLETGGQVTLLEVLKGGKWLRPTRRDRTQLSRLPTRYRKVDIAARPFMRPALEAEAARFPELFRNAVRG